MVKRLKKISVLKHGLAIYSLISKNYGLSVLLAKIFMLLPKYPFWLCMKKMSNSFLNSFTSDDYLM